MLRRIAMGAEVSTLSSVATVANPAAKGAGNGDEDDEDDADEDEEFLDQYRRMRLLELQANAHRPQFGEVR